MKTTSLLQMALCESLSCLVLPPCLYVTGKGIKVIRRAELNLLLRWPTCFTPDLNTANTNRLQTESSATRAHAREGVNVAPVSGPEDRGPPA